MSALAPLTTPQVAWVSLVVTATLAGLFKFRLPEALFGYEGAASLTAPDMTVWPPRLGVLFTAYGKDGLRAVMITHSTFDVLFPFAYALLILNVLVRVHPGAEIGISAVISILPLMAGAADLIENLGLFLLARQYRRQLQANLPRLAWLTCFFTTTKFALLVISIGAAFAWGFA